VEHAIEKGIVTPDLGGSSTTFEVGDSVAEFLRSV
jgi:isocitrate/isopropylmalate dehydrogenase